MLIYGETQEQYDRRAIYLNLLAAALRDESAVVQFPQLELDAREIVESRAVQMLWKIRQILADERLDDPDCVEKIEEIVQTFEDNGIPCGGRHDF
jgi:hypothetical protein